MSDVVSLLPQLRAIAATLESGDVEKGDKLLDRTLRVAVERVADSDAEEDLFSWLQSIMRTEKAILDLKRWEA